MMKIEMRAAIRLARRSAPRRARDRGGSLRLGGIAPILALALMLSDASLAQEPVAMGDRASSPPSTPADAATSEESKPAATVVIPDTQEEILLTALDELPTLDYAAPAEVRPRGWMRQFGPVRAAGDTALVEVRAPIDHAGLSIDESPRLWWSLSEATPLSLQLTVVDEEGLDPILRAELRGPHAAGLHSLDLGDHGVTLASGVEYRWFVAVMVDPERPSRNPTSAGALRRLTEDDDRRLAVEAVPPYARGHTLAELGIWYDAFDFFASLAVRHPEIERLARDRDRLAALARAGR